MIAGLATAWSATARLAWPLVVFAAFGGWVLAWRAGRLSRPDRWAVAVGAGVFLLYAAPILLTGAETFGGYIKLDDTATWLGITDHVMHHGRALAGLAPSSYSANLHFYLTQTGYPIGSFLPLGVGQALVGKDVAWLFQPYESFLAAALGLALYALLGGVIECRAARAGVAFIAAQPALLVGYALWGGVKEVAAAALVPLIAALLPALVRRGARPREALGLAVVCGAMFGVLGLGAGPWLAPPILAWLVLLVRGRRGGRTIAAFAAGAFLLSLPAFLVAGAFVRGGLPTFTGDGFSSKYANLFHPISPLQLLGIWPSGDFRITPDPVWPTDLFLAVGIGAGALGAALLWRRRRWALLAYPAGVLLACLIIGAVAQPWLVAKALASAAPALLLLALVGVAGLAARVPRGLAVALGALLALGVLGSNVLAYTQMTPAPGERFDELESLGHRIAGQGPTLVTEPEIYADRHFLRASDPEGAGDLRVRQIPLSGGGSLLNGAWADLDAFIPSALVPYRTIVLRRSPVESRPPYPYRRVWRGRWFEAWQRTAPGDAGLVEHDGLGDNFTRPYCGKGAGAFLGRCGVKPAAVARCSQITRLASVAREHRGYLLAVPRENPIVLEPDALRWPAGWLWDPFRGWLAPQKPGAAEATIEVARGGRYEAWLGGSFSRPIVAALDDRPLGRAEWQPSNFGQYVRLAALTLAPGRHVLTLRADGPGWHPGSAESRPDFNRIGPFVLAPAGADAQPAIRVPAGQATSLCGRTLDWVEVISGA